MGVDRRSELQAALQAKRDEISSSKARTEAAQSQLATVRGERDRLDAQITASYEELALRIDGSLHEELESWRQRFAGARDALHRAEHDRDELLRRAQLKGEGDAKLLARAGAPPRAPMTEEERALVQKRIAKGKDTLEKRMTVGGLAPEVTKAELRAHFAAYGAVTEVHIETDYVTKASKGHGHVTYAAGVSIDAVQAASHELRGQRLELGRPTFREKPPDRDHIVDGMLWENVGRIHRFSAKARTTVPATYVKVKAGDHVGKVGRLDREKKSKVAVTLFPEGQLEVAADAVAVKRKLRMSDSAVAEAQYEKWAREHEALVSLIANDNKMVEVDYFAKLVSGLQDLALLPPDDSVLTGDPDLDAGLGLDQDDVQALHHHFVVLLSRRLWHLLSEYQRPPAYF